MNNTGILVASFGTTHDDTREKNIGAVVRAVGQNFAPAKVYEAFTSGMVRSALAKRGILLPDAAQALEQMHRDGMQRVAVLPTHLLYGEEYDKLCALVESRKSLFSDVKVAKPLLAEDQDFEIVLNTLSEALSTNPGEALVLMGHGTAHFCNTVYAALDYKAKAMGLSHVFVGTVEAFPELDTTIAALKKAGFARALVTPLMLVAGDHAVNDMASDEPESWKSRLTSAGISCRAVVRGLGEYDSIRNLYCSHLKEAMNNL